MSVDGKAFSTTRRSSSRVPSTATIGALAGTTMVVRVWGDSVMVRPLGLLALLPVSVGASATPVEASMLGDRPRAAQREICGGWLRRCSGAEGPGVAGDRVGRPVEAV